MKSTIARCIAGILLAATACASAADPLDGYRAAGAGPFSAAAGKAAWNTEHRPSSGEGARSCASCHGTDLGKPGRHVKTGKPIEPMALSVNPARLGDPEKVATWFRRNCRWTLGRDCTPQEKGDFVQFMISE